MKIGDTTFNIKYTNSVECNHIIHIYSEQNEIEMINIHNGAYNTHEDKLNRILKIGIIQSEIWRDQKENKSSLLNPIHRKPFRSHLQINKGLNNTEVIVSCLIQKIILRKNKHKTRDEEHHKTQISINQQTMGQKLSHGKVPNRKNIYFYFQSNN
jgi:hypothetical protein